MLLDLEMPKDRATIHERYGWSSPERKLARALARFIGDSQGKKARLPVAALAVRARMRAEDCEAILSSRKSLSVIRRIIACDVYAVKIELHEGVVQAWHA